jgi:3-deoxy-7-phosphoheptulonate synthase
VSVAIDPGLDNRRIASSSPLLSPSSLRHDLPTTPGIENTVADARADIIEILAGRDDRLLVVVGPCSIHDPAAAFDYANLLADRASDLSGDLRIVMRTYFEKPRTTLGWKGLINDPHLDGTFDVNGGLRIARQLLLDVSALGLPVGCEFLDPITPQYIADVVSWGSIGARTAASQTHRQLCSALSMPIGIKNSTSGNVAEAVDGVAAAAAGHVFMGIDGDGRAAVFTTTGNADCHVILRGGANGPNYSAADVASTVRQLSLAGLTQSLVIDASHGNSGKDHARQPAVVRDIAGRIGRGEQSVVGLMLESFLVAVRQDFGPHMTRGQSVTDACMDWETTATLLDELAGAVRARRARI